VTLYEQLAELPLEVEDVAFTNAEREVSSGFLRRSTIVRLRGGGEEGIGEDVTYDAALHLPLQQRGGSLELRGATTLDGFSQRLAGLDLFLGDPLERDVYRLYRRWAFESAALDLALRQRGTSLAALLGLEPRPVRFVVSLRLGEPPSLASVEQRLALYPWLRFKLDATPSWDEALCRRVAATGAVDSIDLKGAYRGTIVDAPADPALYRRVAECFPHAWIEDPDLDGPTADALAPYHDRITWDAVIHDVDDIRALPFPPRMVNVKPSRFGSLRALLAAYEHCGREGIAMYGGGQFELDCGRGQIQYLASLFHPDGPNDIAPAGYNEPEPRPGLPSSPLPPAPAALGFRWDTGTRG
jgi:L-alanine-DL-glutamate epimerase-like enolase superfamily enzyme